MLLSIVIPLKNEAENIGPLVAEIHTALSGFDAYEIICVDDGSADGTSDRVRGLQANDPRVRLVRHAASYGQSAAIHTGVSAATGTWIGTLDGDGQNDPADLPALWAIASNAPPSDHVMVCGWRAARKDSTTKKLTSAWANRIRAWALQDHTPDTGCGLKLFKRDDFLEFPYFDHMHRFLPALARRHGGQAVSVKVNHRPRIRGKSNYGTLDRLRVGIVDLLGVMWLQRRAVRRQILAETSHPASPPQ